MARTPQPGQDDWEYLDEHLVAVARRTEQFASSFGEAAGRVGALAGLWHDLGKQNPEFQDYLWNCHLAASTGRTHRRQRIPHAIWGAAFAQRFLQFLGRADRGSGWEEIVLPVLGHHSGLPDRGDASTKILAFQEVNAPRLSEMKGLATEVVRRYGPEALSYRTPVLDDRQRELRVRMLFSALVDADSLVSEEHRTKVPRGARREGPSIMQLWQRFLASDPPMPEQSTDVQSLREEVLAACLNAFDLRPGFFRLAVPTGGGKTRSGIAFALKHALEHELQRIIVALPYTSIIDQTAKDYRAIFGDDAVLEHHSAVEITDREGEDETAVQLRLAAENWDAPIIVTTTVQLFESLFGNTRSKARKLHRLARSVIILDEVQTLPPELLLPTLDVLRELATPISEHGFGASVVLSTATQPAFESGPLATVFSEQCVRDIVPASERLYSRLRRVRYQRIEEPVTWVQVADLVQPQPQVMVVLNTRADALAALAEIGGDRDEAFHLSTLLCTAHRRALLDQVQARLANRLPVKLVSTQVVECGVNLDFPVVYRAIGPLDRIVQVAGRCNRNGMLEEGEVFVFEPVDGRAPSGPYRDGIETARLLLSMRPIDDLHRPDVYRDYFRRLYGKVQVDARHIQEYRAALNYPKVARLYKMIEPTVPVVVPYRDSEERLADWHATPSRRTWQRLQPFLVSLYERDVARMGSLLTPLSEGLYLCPPDRYDIERHRGVVMDVSDPADLIV